MAVCNTSLSVGAVIREILLADEAVAARTNKVFPVAVDKAELPYILYRRSSLSHDPTKSGARAADTVQVEIFCYTEKYAEGIELAECVRAALDYKQYDAGNDLVMRACTLTDAEETWEDDAYVQQLTFNIKI